MITSKVKAELRHKYYQIRPPEYIRQLNILEKQLLDISDSIPKSDIRIVYGPSFSIYEPCFIHDRILSIALRLRGATILPIYCDQVQESECNVNAGEWMGASFNEACLRCNMFSKLLWNKSFKPYKLSQWLPQNDSAAINLKVQKMRFDEIIRYQEDGFPLGQWCEDIIVNSYMVGDFTLIENYEDIFKTHLENILRLKTIYKRMVSDLKPDRIVSNDSFYGMWGILEKLSIQENLDFYSHWEGDRKDAWCYAYQDAAMKLDFRKPWEKYSKQPLSDSARAKVKNWLENRTQGLDMILNTAAIGEHHTDEFSLSTLENSDKPKALLCANVIWDCAALNKQIIFEDMMDWLIQIIKWFESRPEYELIIKPHPVEENPLLPQTVETVQKSLLKRDIKIPSNVFLLSAKVKCTVYDLFRYAKVGLMHTSTVGMEMAALGMPVITSAKAPYRGYGFTIDCSDKSHFFNQLIATLDAEAGIRTQQIENAYKFIYFYRFHYYTKIDIMSYEFSKEPKVLIENIDELRPGSNPALDYIVDKILDGKPIIDENNWMAES
tara:strand:- start:36088 stop:37740 length:1653 start_codon:yes stop_codon:yes gene_type:complete